jgi:hypothetical protein
MKLATASRATDWIQETFAGREAVSSAEVKQAAEGAKLPDDVREAVDRLEGGPWTVGQLLTHVYDELLEDLPEETNTAGGLDAGSNADYRWGEVDDVELQLERLGRMGEAGRAEGPERGS